MTPRTVACQAPLSMGFHSQESWSGLLFPSPGNLSNPQGSNPYLLHGRQILYCWATGEAHTLHLGLSQKSFHLRSLCIWRICESYSPTLIPYISLAFWRKHTGVAFLDLPHCKLGCFGSWHCQLTLGQAAGGTWPYVVFSLLQVLKLKIGYLTFPRGP